MLFRSALPLVTSRIFGFITEYSLVAIPMFILMAALLDRSGIARDLFRGMRILAGRLPGGVAVQTLIVAILMAAMSGVIGGEIVLLGILALPQMLRLGYDRNLSIGVVVAGGSLGTMMPPSIVLIIYGLVASVSIADLFVAAITPALLLLAFYVAYVLLSACATRRWGHPCRARNWPRSRSAVPCAPWQHPCSSWWSCWARSMAASPRLRKPLPLAYQLSC